MFLVNSRLGLVTAATSRWHPFSRGYGAILPSSLERVLSRPSVCSTTPPVSVSSTGVTSLPWSGLFWEDERHHFLPVGSRTRAWARGVFAALLRLGRLHRDYRSPDGVALLRHPSLARHGTGMLTRCPSTTPFGLALGPDLPSADEPSGGTLGVSGLGILTQVFAT